MRQTMEKCFIHFKLWFFVIVEEVRLPKKEKKEQKNACLPLLMCQVSHLLWFEDYAVCSFSLFSVFNSFDGTFCFSGMAEYMKKLCLVFCFSFCLLEWLQSKPQVYSFHNVMEKSLFLCYHLGFIHFPHLPSFCLCSVRLGGTLSCSVFKL